MPLVERFGVAGLRLAEPPPLGNPALTRASLAGLRETDDPYLERHG